MKTSTTVLSRNERRRLFSKGWFRKPWRKSRSRARRSAQYRPNYAAAEALEHRILLSATAVKFDPGVEGAILNQTFVQAAANGRGGQGIVGLTEIDHVVSGFAAATVDPYLVGATIEMAATGSVLPLSDSDQFGYGVANLGDLDGDGVSDRAVSAFGDADGGSLRGAVYVLFMNSDGTVKYSQKISSTAGGFSATLEDGDVFGTSVASLGDLDGDGLVDLAVGARGDDDGGSNRGAVYVLFLNQDGTVKSHQKISSLEGNFAGALLDGDNFGQSLASLGDLDGDGVVEMAVGATWDNDGGNNRGAVYVLFLNANGTVKAHQKISDTAGNFGGGLDDVDTFGRSLAGLGDLDGDGVNDLAVGADLDDDGGTNRGAVYILNLNADGTVKSRQKISAAAGGLTAALDDSDLFGSSVASVGDLDGDGVADLAVGARGDDDGGSGRGAAYVLFLNSDGTVKAHQKISNTDGGFSATLDNLDSFGSSVSSLGDLNGDGIVDLAVGATGDDDGGGSRGALYVLFLNADGTVQSYQKISDNASSPFPLSQTFALHSNPGANHTIYLDFNGHTTTGTSWNTANGGAAIVSPAYDLDGDATTFSDSELIRIQYIWQRVVEDFLPFNVNVTTQDPGTAALRKTNSNPNKDPAWGIRVVIGGSSSDWYGSSVGGIALVGSFNHSTDTPAFVFTAGGGGEKTTAEAISHEVGHSLGLSHDGTPTSTYYLGQGSGKTGWAPIMGSGIYKEVTQWSKGQYLNANNTQDDLAIITTNNGFGYRVDDHGNSRTSASPLSTTSTTISGSGIIERNTDFDWFSFSTVGGLVDINIDPAERGANLDILAQLYDASNALIASSNPANTLDALFQVNLTAGQYYLSITGTGKGDPLVEGYTDYGSLGQYFISGTMTAAPPNALPIAAAGGLYTVPEGSSVMLSAAGSSDSDGTIVSYEWDLDNDGQYDDATGVNVSFSSNQDGVHTVGLRVTDNWGGVSTDTATVTVSNLAPTAVAGGPYLGNEGSSILLSGAGSSDPANDIVSYEWDLDGDGQYDDATGISAAFLTTIDGVYTVGLRVTDNAGAASTDTAQVTINNVGPTADAGGPYVTQQSVSVLLTAAGSTDPGHDIASYAWDLDNDGLFDDATGITVVFTSASTGSFPVAVRVIDDDGAVSTSSAIVTVNPLVTETTVFQDSFEIGEWNGLWVEDSQNDWFRSTQRATNGSRSAEVDGSASNATLTTASSFNLSSYSSATLTFSWYIESSLDTGEYVAFDISTNGGATWQTNVLQLRGNVDQENVWHHETVDLTPYLSSDFRFRFRAKMSGSDEDANVDNVRLIASGNAAATSSVAFASALIDEGNNETETGILSGRRRRV